MIYFLKGTLLGLFVNDMDDLKAALHYAARQLDHPILTA